MSRYLLALAVVMTSVAIESPAARADLVIGLDNLMIAPAGTGTMNISIMSNAGDMLSTFQVELMITPVSASSILAFSPTQPDPYSNPNYVFLGQSFNVDNPPAPFWNTTNPQNPFVTIVGGDSDATWLDPTPGFVTIPATAGVPYSFLTSVQLQAPLGAAAGDQFLVTLVDDPGQTYFDDPNGDPINYSTSGGYVTVQSVPEPSSIVLVGIAIFGAIVAGRWKRNKHVAGCRPRETTPRQER